MAEVKPNEYIYNPAHHNLDAPREIVPHLTEIFHPKSVVDTGCGNGTFLHVFSENGVKDIQGIDGKHVDQSKLFIDPVYFMEGDLSKKIVLSRKFDLVICLEVGEHLPETSADMLVDNLVSYGNIIVFSAAIKNQGGQHHLNEQAFDYWAGKFEKRGFYFYDVFRKIFWNNTKINWWYRQNMFLVAHESVAVSNYYPGAAVLQTIPEYVHPELLALYVKDMHTFKNKVAWIKNGEAPFHFYLHLLRKKISGKFSKKPGSKTD